MHGHRFDRRSPRAALAALLRAVNLRGLAPMAVVGSYVCGAVLWLLVSDTVFRMLELAGEVQSSDAGEWNTFQVCLLVLVTAAILHRLATRQRGDRADQSEQLKALVDGSSMAVALADPDGLVTYANAAFLRLTRAATHIVGNVTLDTVLSPFECVGASAAYALPSEGRFTLVPRAEKGSSILLEVRRLGKRGRELGWLLYVSDTSAAARADSARAIAEKVASTLTEAVIVVDATRPDMPIVYANEAFEEITGYPPADIMGRNCRFLQGSDRSQPEIAELRDAIALMRPTSVVLRNYRQDGSMFLNALRLAPVRGLDGECTHFVATSRDITATQGQESLIARLTSTDPISGQLNAHGFLTALENIVPKTAEPVLVRFDGIRFKEVAATYGAGVTDAIVREIADRLSQADALLIGHLGGDEFAVLVEGEGRAPIEIAEELRALLNPLFQIPGASIQIFFSFGVAVGGKGIAGAQLLQRALIALLLSKQTGIGAARCFDEASERETRLRVNVSSYLQQAIVYKDFTLQFQPVVELDTGAVIGAEGLVRWRHPLFGLQPPKSFLPVAEQTGHIIEIGLMTFRQAFVFARRLNEGSRTPLAIALNLSALQVKHSDVASTLAALSAETGCDPDWITLEASEGVLAERTPETIQKLVALRKLGFKVMLDDFGTGRSSLRHLSDLPITGVKLDRSLVQNVSSSHFKRTVVGAMVGICDSLGATVSVEGVETDAERRTLLELGVRAGQGFFFSLPLDESEFLDLAQSQLCLPALRASPLVTG